ncbi:MAG: hypothetical protein K6F05_06570 [Succinivibrio sp.]|nr:hypothetical protein [Succinivibrio sp.]
MSILEEVKATLAMEDLTLNQDEEQLLKDYAEGKLSFAELRVLLNNFLTSKAA